MRLFFPAGKYTWLIIIGAIFLYMRHYDQTGKVLPDNEFSDTKNSISDSLDGKNVDVSFFDNPAAFVAQKVSNTDMGREMLKNAVEKKMEDVFETSNILDVLARKTNRPQYLDRFAGTGSAAQCGDTVKIHHRSFQKGVFEYDNSYDSKEPLQFTLGSGEVIRGLEQAVEGMKAGGKRKIIIPPKYGYDDERFSSTVVSEGSLITIEAELLEVISNENTRLDSGLYSISPPIISKKRVKNEALIPEVMCGDIVTISITHDQTYSEDSFQTVSLKVGDAKASSVLQNTAMGMKPGEIRPVVIQKEHIETVIRDIGYDLPEQLLNHETIAVFVRLDSIE